MDTLPNDLPRQLRQAGFKVKVVRGWRHRKTNSDHRGFGPVGVGIHHTATGKQWPDNTVQKLLVQGRPGLSGPLCQLGLQRDGTVVVVAKRRANHMGTAKSVGSVASGDGNFLYIGIEAYNDGLGEKYPDIQYQTYVRLAGFLCAKVTKNSIRTVAGHKETSVTGKVDPRFSMDNFRKNAERERQLFLNPPKLEKPTLVEKATHGPLIDQGLANLRQARDFAKKKGWKRRIKHLQLAIDQVDDNLN